MSGERLGILSLKLDAAYCLILGLLVAILGPVFAATLKLPTAVVVSVGVTVVGWSGVVVLLLTRTPLRRALQVVLVVNLAAAAGIAAYSTTVAALLVALSALAVALDVGLFASSQAVALRRMRRS